MYHRTAIIATEKKNLKGMSVLDLGCGRGGGLAFLVDHFDVKEAVGIDICSR